MYGQEFGQDIHTVQNSNTHNINTSLDMRRLYKYIGLEKKPTRTVRTRTRGAGGPPGQQPEGNQKPKNSTKAGTKLLNAGIDIVTSIKRVQINYSENNGTFLPGYTLTPGFVGTLKPSFGFTFGSQNDIRQEAARRGWLTTFQEFNQQFTQTHSEQLDISASLEPVRDLKIDITGNKTYFENFAENYRVDPLTLDYIALTPNTFGNFNISTVLIKTAFSKSDETTSDAFNDFRANRLTVARRVAAARGADVNDVDAEGFPRGFGKNSQAVLLPAFLAAYSGQDPNNVKLDAFRSVPIPNWDIKYTGFMKFAWFKKNFRRFSVTHGYRSSYNINQFQTNLDFNDINYSLGYDAPENNDTKDQSGNYKTNGCLAILT